MHLQDPARAAVAVLLAGLALSPAAAAAAAAPKPAPTSAPLAGETRAPSGQQAQTLTFGLKPKDSARGAAPRGSFRFRLDPGLTGSDTVSVYNYATSPLDLSLYPSDAETNRQGAYTVPPAGTRARDVGSWIRLALPAHKVFRVPARTKVDVGFAVIVPAAANPGDHLGGIVVSLLGNSTDAKGNRIKVDSRVSVPITVRVAGALHPQLQVENFHARYLGVWTPLGRGEIRVSYTVHNTGNILLGAKQRLGAEGWFGQRFTPGPADLAPLAPDSSTDVAVVVPNAFPVLRYQARVVITPTSAAGDPFPVAATASHRLWAVPWPLLTTVFLMTAAAYARHRVRASRPIGKHQAARGRQTAGRARGAIA